MAAAVSPRTTPRQYLGHRASFFEDCRRNASSLACCSSVCGTRLRSRTPCCTVTVRSGGDRVHALCRSLAGRSTVSAAIAVELSLDEVLDRIRDALHLEDFPHGALMKLTGTQELMALEGSWEFVYSSFGEYSESYVGSDLTCITASDGMTAWEADAAGRIAILDLDDYEMCMLTSWLRTGFWLDSRAKKALDIRALDSADLAYLSGLGEPFEVGNKEGRYYVAVSIRSREVTMYVCVSTSDWLPTGAILKAYGATAQATLEKWHPVALGASYKIPGFSSFLRDSGDMVLTKISNVEVLHLAEEDGLDCGLSSSSVDTIAATSLFPRETLFKVPTTGIVPVPLKKYPVAKLGGAKPWEVEAVSTSSGHILVRPTINGQDVGYFILDTGASTFTIEPSVADKLSLRKFGCVHTITVNGPAKCSFREGTTFSLGPLRISHPRFVDVAGASLAERGLPVVGICGYDVFQKCAVLLKRAKGQSKQTLILLDPSKSVEDVMDLRTNQHLEWIPVRMLCSTPHISIRFQTDPQGEWHEAMFLVDTGAAGTDLIFNSAATAKFGLWPRAGSGAGGGLIRGMGTKGKENGDVSLNPGMTVTQRNLACVELLPGVLVRKPTAIVMAPNQNGLQLSSYTAGLLCQNLLQDFDVLFDYRNNRIGIIVERSFDNRTPAFRGWGG